MPSKVSVVTSVFVVLFSRLSTAAGPVCLVAFTGSHAQTVLLQIVIFAVPGAMLGGQLGPYLVSHVPQRGLERGLHILLLLSATLTRGEAVL